MNATQGMTGDEIIAFVQSFTGNTSSSFQSFLTTILPLAEFRYCKIHPWSFLNKRSLSLTVSSGTDEYALNTANIGYEALSAKVQSVYSQSSKIYLKKTSIDEIRRMDPGHSDGSTSQKLTHWAEASDNTIIVYPPTFSDIALKLDGQVLPTALLTTANYPTVPFRCQDAFVQYILALALQRENDDRFAAQAALAKELIRGDISEDLANLAGTDEPRMRHLQEQRLDGLSGNPDPLNLLFDPYVNY